MKRKILPAIGATVVLAACGGAAAATSHSIVGSASAGPATTQVRSGSNAGLAVQTGNDVTPVNPALVKVNGRVTTTTTAPPNPPAVAPATQSFSTSGDRCSGGLPGTANGAHATTGGKPLPLPACMPE